MTGLNKKILLIDDDEITLTIAEVILQGEYQIFKAKSGKIALEYLTHIRRGFTPDLILLDIIMPVMDGWETFKKIKEIGLLKKIPIIFLTSVKEIESNKRAMDMGAHDYIVKPYNRDDLLKRVNEAIDKQEIKVNAKPAPNRAVYAPAGFADRTPPAPAKLATAARLLHNAR